ncbi:MAG: helix-turn-helix domain-containing protein [Candidatus Thiodiazotropha sp.]
MALIVGDHHFQPHLALRGYPPEIRFSRDAMRSIMNYPWPGNVRELANVVEHSVICAVDGEVLPQSLPDTLRDYCQARMHAPNHDVDLSATERDRIETALIKANNKTLAAQILGVDRSTLWRRMQRLDMN